MTTGGSWDGECGYYQKKKESGNKKKEMPLPLSFAFFGVHFARRLHHAPTFRRPVILKNIYYARVLAYSGVACASLHEVKKSLIPNA